MQSIERYGLVALLFLVVTVVAAVVWEGEPGEPGAVAHAGKREVWEAEPAPAPMSRPPAGAGMERANAGVPPADSSAISLRAKPKSRPISRDSFEAAREAERREALASRSELASQVSSEPETGRDPTPGPEVRRVADVVPPAVTQRAPEGSKASKKARAGQGGPGQRMYVVKSTDTLSEIAQRELGTFKRWKEIVALNPGLDPAKLHVGLKLVLPSADVPSTSEASVASTEVAPATRRPASKVDPMPQKNMRSSRTYVVKRGDSLWKIATNELGDGKRWPEIVDRNPSLDPDRLAEGRVLELPEGSAPAAKKTASEIVATNTGSRPKRTVR